MNALYLPREEIVLQELSNLVKPKIRREMHEASLEELYGMPVDNDWARESFSLPALHRIPINILGVAEILLNAQKQGWDFNDSLIKKEYTPLLEKVAEKERGKDFARAHLACRIPKVSEATSYMPLFRLFRNTSDLAYTFIKLSAHSIGERKPTVSALNIGVGRNNDRFFETDVRAFFYMPEFEYYKKERESLKKLLA